MKTWKKAAVLAATMLVPQFAGATDLEVIHWWTSRGESRAVAQFAKAFNNDGQGDHWIDDAIAGGGGATARSTIMQRILGGDPPGAAQFNPGLQYEQLIKNGLLQNLDELAKKEDWAKIIRPKKIQSACLVDGHWYCVPVNIHSWDWAWYSYKPFRAAGLPNPTNFQEFLADAPKLKAAGFIPFAIGGANGGWQITGAFNQILVENLGVTAFDQMYKNKDLSIAGGKKMLQALTEFKSLKQYSDPGYANRNWNDTTNLVITGKAALQIMGDWARGEFAAAGMTGVKDYGCMIGLNEDKPLVTTDGDVIVFPKNSDPKITAAQMRLAALLISPKVQVDFNNAKGSMPVRGDVNMAAADPCMQKALKAVEHPDEIVGGTNRYITPDTNNQLNALVSQFWSDDSMTPAQAQAKWVEIFKNAG